MTYNTIILEKKDHIARLTLNRPERLNAANEQMFSELNSALADVAGDREIRALVLTGAGRAFCASADIKDERREADRLLGHMEPYQIYQFIRSGPQGITLKLHQMEIPTIAMVNGLAIGDGFDWALACDIRIGCERSRFMNAFLQMGLVSNTGQPGCIRGPLGSAGPWSCCTPATGWRRRTRCGWVCSADWCRRKNWQTRRWPWPPESPDELRWPTAW